jgi:hypothetical protein
LRFFAGISERIGVKRAIYRLELSANDIFLTDLELREAKFVSIKKPISRAAGEGHIVSRSLEARRLITF